METSNYIEIDTPNNILLEFYIEGKPFKMYKPRIKLYILGELVAQEFGFEYDFSLN